MCDTIQIYIYVYLYIYIYVYMYTLLVCIHMCMHRYMYIYGSCAKIFNISRLWDLGRSAATSISGMQGNRYLGFGA